MWIEYSAIFSYTRCIHAYIERIDLLYMHTFMQICIHPNTVKTHNTCIKQTCINEYIYTCVQTVHGCMRTYIRTFEHKLSWSHVFIPRCIFTVMHTHPRFHAYKCIQCGYTYKHTYTHSYTHTDMYMHLYLHKYHTYLHTKYSRAYAYSNKCNLRFMDIVPQASFLWTVSYSSWCRLSAPWLHRGSSNSRNQTATTR